MAGTISHACPYTGTSKVAFSIHAGINHHGTPTKIDAFGVCGDCHRAVLLTMEWKGSRNAGMTVPWTINGNVSDQWTLISSYPPPPSEAAPEHTPDAVATAFQDAKRSLNNALWTPAGIMARKAIDVSTKSLDLNTKKGSKLQDRIDKLRTDGLITEALKLMGHVVRLDGNDAAHEEEPFTEQEAKQICEFAELFLRLTFTVNGAASAVAKAKHPKLLEGKG